MEEDSLDNSIGLSNDMECGFNDGTAADDNDKN